MENIRQILAAEVDFQGIEVNDSLYCLASKAARRIGLTRVRADCSVSQDNAAESLSKILDFDKAVDSGQKVERFSDNLGEISVSRIRITCAWNKVIQCICFSNGAPSYDRLSATLTIQPRASYETIANVLLPEEPKGLTITYASAPIDSVHIFPLRATEKPVGDQLEPIAKAQRRIHSVLTGGRPDQEAEMAFLLKAVGNFVEEKQFSSKHGDIEFYGKRGKHLFKLSLIEETLNARHDLPEFAEHGELYFSPAPNRHTDSIYDGLFHRPLSIGPYATLPKLAMSEANAVAINGGFFSNFAEPEIVRSSYMHEPSGLFYRDGLCCSLPTARRATLIGKDSNLLIQVIGPQNIIFSFAGITFTGKAADSPECTNFSIGTPDKLPTIFTPAEGEETPPESGVRDYALIGNEIVASCKDGNMPIPITGLVLRLACDSELDRRIQEGLQQTNKINVRLQSGDIDFAVSAGPMLVTNGKVIESDFFEKNDTEDWIKGSLLPTRFPHDASLTRAARSAVGLTADRRVIFAVVDLERSAGQSRGATLEELGKIMKALGATVAMNLDGGGSSAIGLKRANCWELLNRPSDPYPYRRLSNALCMKPKSK